MKCQNKMHKQYKKERKNGEKKCMSRTREDGRMPVLSVLMHETTMQKAGTINRNG